MISLSKRASKSLICEPTRYHLGKKINIEGLLFRYLLSSFQEQISIATLALGDRNGSVQTENMTTPLGRYIDFF